MPPKKSKSAKSSSRGQFTSQSSKDSAIQGLSSTNSAAKTLKRLTVDEGIHDDDEVIYPGRFPFKDLIPGWATLDVHTKNPATGSIFSKAHHIPGVGAKTKKSFEDFTFAFCLEWVWDENLGKFGEWRRCYNEFCVDSQQCISHPKTVFKDGCNQIWGHMKQGRTGNWGMLKNRYLKEEERPLSEAEQNDRELAQMTAEMELRCANGENGAVVWKELTAKRDEEKRIAKKIQREVARTKANSVEEATQNIERSVTQKGRSRKLSYKSDDGRPDLDAKSALNPNQRGKKSGKAITNAFLLGADAMATIEEE